MKTAILLLCILAVGLTQAFTLDKPIIKLQPTLQETKSKDGAIGRSWIDCTKPGGPGKILNLTITPDPPERGEPIAFYFVFSDSEEVTAGKTLVNVKWETIVIADVSVSLCEEVTCPLRVGTHSLSLTWPKLPADAPAGRYTAKFVVTNQDEKELGCVGMAWSFA